MEDLIIDIVNELEKHTDVNALSDGEVVEYVNSKNFFMVAKNIAEIITNEKK